jgi:acyl-CoA reductase-like NAD-dependent aldehyde dehydrogenase
VSTKSLTRHPGSFVAGSTHGNEGEPLPVTNPATGEVWAEVPGGTSADIDAAVGAAKDAFGPWSGLSVSRRGEILGQAVGHARRHLDEMVEVMVREQGKTIRDARIEIPKAFQTISHYVGMAMNLRGIHTPMLDPGVDGYVLRRPLGVVGAIIPWNFPTTLLANKLGPALVAGNTMVAKPAGTTPLVTLRLAELLVEGGLPPGVFNVVAGSGSVTGAALVQHPDVRKIAFTGSTPVGEGIAALAAKGTKRVTLELGGSDPMIIADDADLASAASAAAMGRFYNCGQACLAIKRVYVYESVADQVIEMISEKARRLKIGPGDAPGSQLGPLHTAAQRDEVAGQVNRTLAIGGQVTAGGGRPDDPVLEGGFFYEPTVVADPPAGCPMETEEVFGPALPIWRVSGLDEAIERANATEFGLGSSVWTSDLTTARAAAERIEAGYTWINSRTKVYDELPFGGWKSSGFGKEHGTEAFDFYTESKSVVMGAG